MACFYEKISADQECKYQELTHFYKTRSSRSKKTSLQSVNIKSTF